MVRYANRLTPRCGVAWRLTPCEPHHFPGDSRHAPYGGGSLGDGGQSVYFGFCRRRGGHDNLAQRELGGNATGVVGQLAPGVAAAEVDRSPPTVD